MWTRRSGTTVPSLYQSTRCSSIVHCQPRLLHQPDQSEHFGSMMRCSKSTCSCTRSSTVAFPCTCCGELTLWCSAGAFSLSLMDSMNPGLSTLSCHRGDVSLIAMTENTHKRKSLSCYHGPLAGGFAVVTVTPSLVIWILKDHRSFEGKRTADQWA